MIAITESRLTTKKESKSSIEIPDYYIEHTPANQKKVVLYLQDLNINKDEMLESVFIEVLSKSNKNTIIGLYINTQNSH